MAKSLVKNLVPIMLATFILSTLGMFVTVHGQGLRLTKVEQVQTSNQELAVMINKKQDHMMYTLCLIVNEGDIKECSTLVATTAGVYNP